MKLSEESRKIFSCLSSGKDAHAGSVIRALDDTSISVLPGANGGYVFHFDGQQFAIAAGVEFVGGRKWGNLAAAMLMLNNKGLEL